MFEDVKAMLLSDKRMPPPEHIADLDEGRDIYNSIMKPCWEKDTDKRPKFEELHKNNLKLFELNRENAWKNKSDPWTREKVTNVLKSLKKGKSLDPLGFGNEIFHIENAGDDLIDAIHMLMNEIKKQGKVEY